ncbi:MAG: CHAD domain-containing protein, partial [Leptolyngbya sp. LCM1.Bin17]
AGVGYSGILFSMAYRFFRDSTVDADVQRILSEQLEKAIYQLSEAFPMAPARAVHNARKRLKRSRSVLRLVRKSIDKDTYQREKNLLRDLGRVLAPARNVEAYQTTLASLLETYDLTLDADGFTDLQTSLADLQQERLHRLTQPDNTIAVLVGELKQSRTHLAQLSLDKTGWEALAKNAKRLYRQGQTRYQTAYDTGSDEAFHEWRKRVKDLWHDTRLLRQLWPPVMKAFDAEAHQLSRLLGDHNDCAELKHFLVNPPDDVVIKDVHTQVLLPLLTHRQDRLQQQMQGLGEKLYSEKPGAFTRRLASYWQVWDLV